MRIIGRFVDSAPAMLKIANNGYEALNAHRRPNISEIGAQNKGPTPKPAHQYRHKFDLERDVPRTYRLNPDIPCSCVVPLKVFIMSGIADE